MQFQELANIIGADNAWRLCKACGGASVYLPEKPMFPGAAEEALAMYRRGYDHREISWALNLRIRDVKRLLREAGEPNWAGARPDPGGTDL